MIIEHDQRTSTKDPSARPSSPGSNDGRAEGSSSEGRGVRDISRNSIVKQNNDHVAGLESVADTAVPNKAVRQFVQKEQENDDSSSFAVPPSALTAKKSFEDAEMGQRQVT